MSLYQQQKLQQRQHRLEQQENQQPQQRYDTGLQTWKFLEGRRAMSFTPRRTTSTTTERLSPASVTTSHHNSFQRRPHPWVPNLFSGETMSIAPPPFISNSPPNRTREGVHRGPNQAPIRRSSTPVLTLALLKLNEHLKEYCQLLEEPTYENVKKACAILDSSVATASTIKPTKPDQNEAMSPKNRGKLSPMAAAITSPSLSPLASWLVGASSAMATTGTTSPTSSALALEGEWETYSNPLILFAALEGIYASLSHAESSEMAHNISQSYQKTAIDVQQLIRERLCDPFLTSNSNIDPSSAPIATPADVASAKKKLSSYQDKAAKVAASMDIIVNICHIRCSLIAQQRELWSGSSSSSFSYDEMNVKDASATFQTFLSTMLSVERRSSDELTTEYVSHHAKTIHQRLRQEVETWYHLMEMAVSIEQCKFLGAIVNAQKAKLRLKTIPKTCLEIWQLRLFQSLLAVFPIVFDKVKSATNTLYGFDSSLFDAPASNRLGPLVDVDATISECLRLQERNSGPPLVVAVLFNGTRVTVPLSRGANLTTTLERGFSIREDILLASASKVPGINPATAINKVNMAKDSQKTPSIFPSIFFRSSSTTNQQQNVPSTSPRLLGLRRNSSVSLKDDTKVDDGGEDVNKDGISQTTTIQNQSLRVTAKDSNEYQEWPYTSWSNLISVLLKDDDTPQVALQGISKEWLEVDDHTLCQATSINQCMWLVALLRSSKEGQSRRSNNNSISNGWSDESQYNLWKDNIVCKLQFSEIFKRAHVLAIRRSRVESGFSFSTESGGDSRGNSMLLLLSGGGRKGSGEDRGGSNGVDFLELLQSFKEELGLRSPRSRNLHVPSSPRHHGLRSGRFGRSPVGSFFRRRMGSRNNTGHFAFFLGNDLINAI